MNVNQNKFLFSDAAHFSLLSIKFIENLLDAHSIDGHFKFKFFVTEPKTLTLRTAW